eukprot:jgi/Galph1/3727/GphlegSOOS_G2382.1
MTREEDKNFLEDTKFVSFRARHKLAHPTIQHWQLRDLVQCENSEEIYVTEGFGIYSVNLKKQLKSPLHLLDFKPTCFSVNKGYLAAGGQNGELKVVRLEDGASLFNGNVGNQVNNAVLLEQVDGETVLFLVSNCRLIQMYRVDVECATDLVLLYRAESSTCLNHVALAPDGKLLLTVGDSGEYFLFRRQGGLRPVTQARISKEPIVSCSWSPDGRSFAVASQDGHVYLLNTEKRKLVGKLTSFQSHGFRGACRCVKFSPSSVLELLAFSEHTNYVHIVDLRNPSRRQILYSQSTERDENIAGFCFSPEGDKLFVGSNEGICEYDIDVLQRRSFGEGKMT